MNRLPTAEAMKKPDHIKELIRDQESYIVEAKELEEGATEELQLAVEQRVKAEKRITELKKMLKGLK